MSSRDTNLYSLTEVFSPQYRNVKNRKVQQNENTQDFPKRQFNAQQTIDPGIFKTIKEISSCIGFIQELFRTRMKVHEEQIIKIAHSELKKIQVQSDNIIEKYSNLIKERNLSSQLLDLKYEVVYYQKKASQLFEENRQLKQQIKELKEEKMSLEIGEQSNYHALKNLSKKYLKEKTLKQKLLFSNIRSNNFTDSNQKIDSLTKQHTPNNKIERIFIEERKIESMILKDKYHLRQKSQPARAQDRQSGEKKTQVSFNIKKLKLKGFSPSSP